MLLVSVRTEWQFEGKRRACARTLTLRRKATTHLVGGAPALCRPKPWPSFLVVNP
jgi:hypothetical protein